MTSVRNVKSTVLSGPRVELRPLRSSDFADWRDVRTRSRDWLEPWEPLAEPGSPDPVTDPEAFRARCGAWERQRHFDTAYGFGLFLQGGSLIGEVSLGSVQRGPFQSAFVGYWIDALARGPEPGPRGRRGHPAVRVRGAAPAPHRGGHRPAQRRLPVASRTSSACATKGLAERFLQIRGVWEDHVRYAITSEEWDVRRDEITRRFLT